MRLFDRKVSIDWSGAAYDNVPVDLAIVEAWGDEAKLVSPPDVQLRKKWTRAECLQWLREVLRPENPRTLIAIDFGFGLPWGADRTVFDCNGWHQMVGAIAHRFAHHGRARDVAMAINGSPAFDGHGPYRFDENRSDFRFYREHGVAYYRIVENSVSQALSQWYMGSGGTVGFHTLTGLASLSALLAHRENGDVAFRVWPHEWDGAIDLGAEHLIAESYPAVYPVPESFGPCVNGHQCDAWKVLMWMMASDDQNRLRTALTLKPVPFGRFENVSFEEQVRFEGWILGVD